MNSVPRKMHQPGMALRQTIMPLRHPEPEEQEVAVSEVRDMEGFAALAPEWNVLLADSKVDCLFLTWEWLYTWWKYLARGRRLRILVVRRGERLIGIAPFALRGVRLARAEPYRSMEFLGAGSVGSDYLDLIFRMGEEKAAAFAIAEYMSDLKYMLDMRRVAMGTANAELLLLELGKRGWFAIHSDDDVCLFVPLERSTWDDFFAGLNRTFRRSLRRGRRSAESTYVLSYQTVREERARSAELKTFISLHYRRWSGKSGSQALPDSDLVRFHEALSRIALDRGWLRLSTLRFDQTPVAGTYGFSYAGKFYFYLSGFDPAFSTYGAGRICLEESLKEAFEENLNEYDFLHGDEKYKYHWAHEYRALGRYRLFPPGMPGRMTRRAFQLRERGKRIFQAIHRSGAKKNTPITAQDTVITEKVKRCSADF